MEQTKQYDIFEKIYVGRSDGNPFTDYDISAVFRSKNETKTIRGFYDGNGKYIVRFMPNYEGEYSYSVSGSFCDGCDFEAEDLNGTFNVLPHSPSDHGPVSVYNKYHFAHADGTPYYSVGTTCYVWELKDDGLIEQTLDSLKQAGFNKIRFCIFPKHYLYNITEPRSYPFEGKPMNSSVITPDNFMDFDYRTEGNEWDLTRFNPEHFRHIEYCIRRLKEIGVEADLILLHPYDRWGFSNLPRDVEKRYLDYVISRFAAFSNVWWSMANEFDILPDRTDDVWKFYGEYVRDNDPYGHPRSVHNCLRIYDHSEDWVTHVSYQRMDLYKTAEDTDRLREQYGKPVVLDEIAYEGNIQCGWGDISGEEMVRRFWEGAMRGGYPGHGETFLSDDGILWWSHGGRLKGESHKRVRFLIDILHDTPGCGLKKIYKEWDCVTAVPEDERLGEDTGYRIDYYSFMRPGFRDFYLDDSQEYEVEVIDTWNMTIDKTGIFKGRFRVMLPGRPYMAIRLKKIL